jgi:hypothetical protein
MTNVAELLNNRLNIRPGYFNLIIRSMPFIFSKMGKLCDYNPIAKALIVTGLGDLVVVGDRAKKAFFPGRCNTKSY